MLNECDEEVKEEDKDDEDSDGLDFSASFDSLDSFNSFDSFDPCERGDSCEVFRLCSITSTTSRSTVTVVMPGEAAVDTGAAGDIEVVRGALLISRDFFVRCLEMASII